MSAKRLLDGVVVLELGTMVTAPLAGRMLADLGARVIKVEGPGSGDPFRRHATSPDSPQFCAYNHAKESIQLDLKSEEGKAAIASLLRSADVVIDNFRPGVMDRLGLDDASLKQLNPCLIRCSITGFGKIGPYKDRPAYDAVAVALSGVASLMLDSEAPFFSGPTIADNVTGMYACYGVLGALYRRALSGESARIDINMLDASVAFIPDCIAIAASLAKPMTPHTRPAISQAYALRCADGEMIALHLSSVQDVWLRLTEALGQVSWLQDARFISPALRANNFYVLNDLLAETFSQQPASYWLPLLEAADIPHAQVRSVARVTEDPQLQALDTLRETVSESGTAYTAVRCPILVDGERAQIATPPPRLGQHTAAVLAEFVAELR